MKTRYLEIQVTRDAYGQEDVSTMTVGELISLLRQYDPNLPVILSHDNGYTYGGLDEYNFEETYYEEEEEEEEEYWDEDEEEDEDELPF